MKLFPYQEEGVNWLQSHFRAILADEPGLGKTLQVLELCWRCPGAKKVLIVCPANVKSVWVKHIREMFPRSAFNVLSGRASGQPFGTGDFFVVVNYDILPHRIDQLAKVNWDMVVFDEAHYLKTVESQRSKATFSKLTRANRVLFLTGTPMLNRPVELWTLLYAIDRDLAGTHREFTAKFCNGHYREGRWVDSGSSNLGELNDLLSKVMIRRKKKDVLPQLPPKIRSVIETDQPLNWESLKSEMGFDWKDTLKGLARKKQTLPQDVLARIRRKDGLAKAPWVARYAKMRLEAEPTSKLILAAHHTDVVEYLADAFRGQCVILTGSTSPKGKKEAVELFQTEEKVRVFIGNIVAAGQGITLTAADRVIFAEQSWVPGEMDQMENRHHRIGKTGTVWVDWIVSPESIDSIICPTLLQKMDKIDQAIDGKPGLELSRDVFQEAFAIFA